ncbi:Rieske (2Fe-2S) protein [Bacteroidota bacterium]
MIESENTNFQKVCKYSDLKEKVGKRFIVDDVYIAVFKIQEKIYAFSNICPHQHSPIIYDSIIEDGRIVCPAHGWEFDLVTGKLAERNRGLKKYEVVIKNGDVFIKIVKRELDW